MRNVTLKQLRALAAVVRTGSITAAAHELHVTAPAVTLQLRLLEESAGLPLLDRTSDGFRLTAAGAEVLAHVQRIERSLAECAEALKLLSGGRGRVSVGVVSTAKYFAPRALGAFCVAHPKVDLRLMVGNRGTIYSSLANYELDLAIAGTPPDTFAIESATIGPHPFVLIGPPGHPLAKRRRLSLADLAGETVLLREQGSGTRVLMERLVRSANVEWRSHREMGSNETIKQTVMAGLGIALISAHTIAAEIRAGSLIVFDVEGLPAMRTWSVIKRKDKRLLPAGQALWDFLGTSGAQFLPEITESATAT